MSASVSFDLTEKVAIVTGASRGIGEAIARAYARQGCRVVLASRKQETLDEVAESMRAYGLTTVLPLAAHTGDRDAVQALVEQTVAHFGGVDILVNNAATNPHLGPLLTAEESMWDKTFDVNIKGYFRTAKACLPSMQERGGGKIINIASIAGLSAQPGMGIYCISKAGVLMMTEVLAEELARYNVQVNAIAPGFIKTRFSQAIWDNDALNAKVLKAIPQRRMADPDELTGIALYLASSASSFTTGATFTVDGGQMAGSGLG